jgi:hypothetical protein
MASMTVPVVAAARKRGEKEGKREREREARRL